jgi:sn-glycerol 3-phosphate transport system permease protein
VVKHTRVQQLSMHLGIFVLLMFFLAPIYLALVAATHSQQATSHAPIPFLIGSEGWHNFKAVFAHGIGILGDEPLIKIMFNSLIMALIIAVGKVFISLISAYGLVYFQFRYKRLVFWLIFLTLMLPVEVRIVPTFEVANRLNLLNSYVGLTLPLMASATATFLFRQFFMTVPKELLEAAMLDGAGPWRFFIDILLPLSKTNVAALFIIMFIYGWNQYLWPLVATTSSDMSTVVMSMQRLASVADQIPQWHYIMMIAICAMLPPVLIIICLQRLFQKGVLEVEK